MITIGTYLILAGILSIFLNHFEIEFFLFNWIERWGEGMGWVVRIGIILAGGFFYTVGSSRVKPINK